MEEESEQGGGDYEGVVLAEKSLSNNLSDGESDVFKSYSPYIVLWKINFFPYMSMTLKSYITTNQSSV